MVLEWGARFLDGLDKAAEDNSTSALDIIVEHCVGIAVSLEGGKRVLEVLELYNDTKVDR